MLNFFTLISQRDQFIEFFSDSLQQKEIFALLMLVVSLNGKRSDFYKATQCMVP